jgi:NitT/TauT family transport system substrate-binding protein
MRTAQAWPVIARGCRTLAGLGVAALVLLASACGPSTGPASGGGSASGASAPVGGAGAPAAPPAAGAAAPAAAAKPALRPLRTAYTTAGATMASIWLAAEQGAFAEQGIDAEVVFIAAGQAILGALSSQETPIVMAGANQVIDANLQGGEYVVLGASMPYITNSIYVHPSITRPEDLRGKTLGVSNFGAISHVAVKVALEHWGFEEGRDVTLVRSGGTPETLAAMQSGAIAGGSFSPPQTFQARDQGFRELIDVSALRYDFGSAALISTRKWVADNPDLVERYLKAIIKGVHIFRTNKDVSVESIMRNTRTDNRPLAEETWQFYQDKMSDDLIMTPRAIENNLRIIGEQRPEALTSRPEQFVDNSVAERIRASGYVEQVKRGQ